MWRRDVCLRPPEYWVIERSCAVQQFDTEAANLDFFQIMRFQMEVRVNSRMACGNQAAAQAAYNEFAEWMERPDRKDFDKAGRPENLSYPAS